MNTASTVPKPSYPRRVDAPRGNCVGVGWKPLYQVAAAAALLSVVFIAIAVVVAIVWPIPTTVEAWFARYHQNALIGLLDLDLPLVASYIAMIPLSLALYIVLRQMSEWLMALALAFSLTGAALMLSVNPSFAMLSLSHQYAAATTDPQRSIALAAAQGLLANWQGTGFVAAYFLGAVAALIIGAVMLRSAVFSKTTAYTGLVMGALTLIPATAGMAGIVASLVALLPTVIWVLLVARELVRIPPDLERVPSPVQ